MPRWLQHILRRLHERRHSEHGPEFSRLIVGSTGSGKSEGELVDLVRLAQRGNYAVVLLDGHGPLAFRTAGHWAERGHESRMVYEPLHAVDRVLCWPMLPKSAAESAARRRIEDAETRDEVAQAFMAQRNLGTLTDKPWTKEWLEAAIALGQAQPDAEPLESLPSAFHVGSPAYERLLRDCERPEVVAKFRDMERLRRKNEVQYEIQTGASRRLLEAVCLSEVVRLRCRPGTFDWLEALRERKLIAFDGGGIRSGEIKRTLFLLASLQVTNAVRRHFALTQRPLPVVLVLEEAGALGLVTPFVLTAVQELRKAGLAVHLITQSTLDFGDRSVFEALLANTPWQAFYQALAPADQELGAKVLANATFDAMQIHFTRGRLVPDGVRPVTTYSRSEGVDAHGNSRHERRTNTIFLPRYRQVEDAYYVTPQLHEQEFRTRLATLGIGERFVRDRQGVIRERVMPVTELRMEPDFTAGTQAVIERIRQQPIYLPIQSFEPEAATKSLPDAATRLRQLPTTNSADTPSDSTY